MSLVKFAVVMLTVESNVDIEAAIKESGAKFVDLKDGGYVAQDKFDTEVKKEKAKVKTAEDERDEAKKALKAWSTKRQEACKDSDCEHTLIITNELRPKMIMAGMTINMVKV